MFMTSCSNDEDPIPTNEEELITTVQLYFNPINAAGNIPTATYRDIDGPGGQAPTITPVQLNPNTNYALSVTVLDESKTPVGEITEEVEEEGDEHQFFYVPSSGLNLTVTYNDADKNNLPMGINNLATTGAASAGTLKVVLKHQPGQKSATSTVNTGETDVEVSFPITIQ
ncbi:hypothetical protein FOA19_07625 [Rufibacter hautae]|uniref:Type 1 periplasmic binding fold superfamily protein n=1 Tax=Rufibacter hautae TaxID=2595005 RepID=A0A5B6TWJ0_9BACT|nr:hypothetical protein FOA19_07625 [Rufibacter hautae]